MALVDPVAQLIRPSAISKRYELNIHEIALEDIEPLGDRYVVEVIDFKEGIVELGQLLVITQDKRIDPRDPMSDPTVENRGVIAGVIVRVGNGHLLGLAPTASMEEDESEIQAVVPMFFTEGDVVLIDYSSKGRALKILGREGRIVGQMDCLARLPMRLKRVDGEWVQE